MGIREDVHSWIQWARSELSSAEEPYPDINEADRPWTKRIYDLFRHADPEELLVCFEEELARDRNDIAVRWPAIEIHRDLSLVDWEETRDEDEDECIEETTEHYEDNHNAFLKNLQHLVRLVEPSDCSDWKRIRWEILNAYAIRDWELARRLYDRAAQLRLPNATEILAARGKFEFLVAFEFHIEESARAPSEKLGLLFRALAKPLLDSQESIFRLDSLWWKPDVVRGDPNHPVKVEWDAILRVLLAEDWSLSPEVDELVTIDTDTRPAIRAAIYNLTEALAALPDLWWQYGATLAKCHYAAGDFTSAAHCYRRLLAACDDDDKDSWSGLFGQRAYQAAARSYERAGELSTAMNLLLECAANFPGGKGIYKQLAEVQAKIPDYEAAAESLRKECDRDPGLSEQLPYSTVLALSGLLQITKSPEEFARAVLASKPEFAFLLDSVLTTFWPVYNRLSEKAQDQWKAGLYLIHYDLQKEPEMRGLRGQTITALALGVELELKDRVFTKFRENVQGKPALQATAQNCASDPFCEFLLKRRDPKITLGQMASVLEKSRASKLRIFLEFNRWLQKRCTGLQAEGPKFFKISESRGAAAHGGEQVPNLHQFSGDCRDAIEVLFKCLDARMQ